MGIFDEEALQMAEEAAAHQRQEAQRAAEIAQVVRTVDEDLMSYIGSHPRQQSIEISVHENRITLQKKATSNTLTCIEHDLYEVAIDAAQATTANKSHMARAVIEWLNR